MRKYNFYPGPSTLPQEVLERFRDEILEYGDAGASFMELSHRGPEVLDCHNRVVATIRALLNIGEEYHVLLLPGGAIGQYAGIAQNLAPDAPAAIAVTGHWSNIAAEEAAKYCQLTRCVDTYPDCRTLPPASEWNIPAAARFVLYVDNETIHGVEFPAKPALDVPLVIDQSSNIFSRPLDMTGVAAVFACLQKNLGPSGLGVVVVRAELCANPDPRVPRIWHYAKQADTQSMVNTIPTFQLRMLDLMLDWTKAQGGTAKLQEVNMRKAQKLYDYIDDSSFYTNPVDPACRSRMNVPFTLADDSLDDQFVREAFAADLLGIRGHRAVGGMRASIYNAMPEAGIAALIDFMREFERTNG